MKRALVLLLAAGLASTASAQTPPAPTACVAPADVAPQHLYGLWQAQFDGLAQGATVLIEKHRELTDSFSGAINRGGGKALLAGDVDDGEFTMEESTDGVSISATWVGTVVDKSCGHEIRGTWQAARDNLARPFVLRKRSGP